MSLSYIYAFPGPHKRELRIAVAEIADRLATICQRYRQTDMQSDRQDNGSIAHGEPLYKRSPKKLQETVFVLER